MNILNIMKQVGEMQGKMQAVQAELEALELGGESGGGLVRVTLNGKGEMLKLQIDPSLVKANEVEILEDLIVAAFQDAKAKASEIAKERMQSVTAGLPLPPGMKLF